MRLYMRFANIPEQLKNTGLDKVLLGYKIPPQMLKPPKVVHSERA